MRAFARSKWVTVRQRTVRREHRALSGRAEGRGDDHGEVELVHVSRHSHRPLLDFRRHGGGQRPSRPSSLLDARRVGALRGGGHRARRRPRGLARQLRPLVTLLDVPESLESPSTSRGIERLDEIAARRGALPHAVAAVKFGSHRRAVCRCGESFDGEGRRPPNTEVGLDGDGLMAFRFREHVNHHRRREAPVDVIEP